MTMSVGGKAPEVSCEAYVRGEEGSVLVRLSELLGKWVVLFFYPRDFTFICPTEIAAFADLQGEFAAEAAMVVGASTDSYYSHKAWFESDARLAAVDFRVLADTSHEVARSFGVLSADGAANRGTFIIDPDGIVRHVSVNDSNVGRSAEETLRVLQALRTGELCPVSWRPGQPTLAPMLEAV